jgi:hypothetical protein
MGRVVCVQHTHGSYSWLWCQYHGSVAQVVATGDGDVPVTEDVGGVLQRRL